MAGSGQPHAKSISLTVGAALTLLGVVTGTGQPVIGHLFSFLEFYAGVFTLVSLTLTVIAGLVATDRLLLMARHRMWVQSIHRTLGIVAVSTLVLHITTEIAGGRVNTFGAVVPFVAARFQIGLGTIAAYLMVSVMWSGIVRARFAKPEKAWMWRPLHATAYLSWPIALWHGLNTGRPAAVWVTASYLLLVLFTLVALGLRLSAETRHRNQARMLDRTTVAVAPVERSTTWDASGGPVWDAPTSERPVYDRPPATYVPEPAYERVPQPDVYWSQQEQARFEQEQDQIRFEQEQARYEQEQIRFEQEQEQIRYEQEQARFEQEQEQIRYEKEQVAATMGRYAVEYPADDTPTLVNLDSQRSMRRGGAAARRGSGTRNGFGSTASGSEAEQQDVTDESYWAVLRGEVG